MAILQAISLLAVVALATAQCPSDFTSFGNNACYMPVAQKKTWMEAERYCNDYSSCSSGGLGHLASIHTNLENSFVTKLYNTLFFQQAEQFWIGLNDMVQQGRFEWSDGWSYAPNQTPYRRFAAPPDAFTPGDCVAVNGNTAAQSTNPELWTVTDCNRRLAFVCIIEDAPAMECPATANNRPV